MRILGVDPGLTRCGLGVVESRPGRKVVLVEVGVARSAVDAEVATRLHHIEIEVERWLDEHRPDGVALERVFAQHNLRTVMGTAQVSGVVMVAAARRGLPVTLHTPSEVKAAVTGTGRAPKAQVQQMVARILGLSELPTPADAADALALGICHLWRPGGAAG
ncbi:crossover junction endodeoxyribonuclease RuvC, partial [Actinotalea sp. C106]|uniref:crossover junction endodeoxyribonuclease RuvC n=1 Tax=Actinotalea sp. C106 TaxID=2908644 RepID=UPI002027F332